MQYIFEKTIIPDKLQQEILDGGLSSIQYIETIENVIKIIFHDILTEQQETTLSMIVSSHDATPIVILPDVTPRQIRQALILSGISLDSIETTLDNLPEPTRSMAKIEWEYSTAFQRNRPLVIQVGTLLGWTSEQLDDLWTLAKGLS